MRFPLASPLRAHNNRTRVLMPAWAREGGAAGGGGLVRVSPDGRRIVAFGGWGRDVRHSSWCGRQGRRPRKSVVKPVGRAVVPMGAGEESGSHDARVNLTDSVCPT